MSADTTLTCRDCGQAFTFTSGEQDFYASRGFSEPSRCPDCRAARKAQRDGGSYDSYGSSSYSRGGYGRSDPAPLPRGADFMHREAWEVLPALLRRWLPDGRIEDVNCRLQYLPLLQWRDRSLSSQFSYSTVALVLTAHPELANGDRSGSGR